jgi:cell division protein FtsI/penicillin-binding protein 2
MSAAVANGGYLVQPHFVLPAEGAVPPARTHIPGLEGSTLTFLQRAMLGVVERPDGTAHWTRIPWLEVAGKTGTAQNPHGDHHSWYTAYAPAGKPEIALAILVENAGHGGDVSAPIARAFMAEYFRPGRRAEGAVSSAQPSEASVPASTGGTP